MEWISIKEKLPEVALDFETTMETQHTSDRVEIKFASDKIKDKQGNPIESIDASFVVLNGEKMWSLDPCATSQYYKLSLASHWRKLIK